MAFEKLIGNETNKKILKETIIKENILHSYLFTGNAGIGKFQFAKEFAKMILCEKKEERCHECKSCKEFESNNHPDFMVIEPDGNTIKVEQIRKMITKVIEKPIISSRKVYIINDSDKMTVEAQNTLLKTLEEPPEYITIILIAEKEGNILNTIKSRCAKMLFHPIEKEKLEEFLKEEYEFESISEHLLKFFNGSIEKALKTKEKMEIYEEIEKIISHIETTSKIKMMKEQINICKNKDDILSILEYINMLFWEQSVENTKKRKKAIQSIDIVEETKRRLQANSNLDMTIDDMLMRLWEEWNEEHNRSQI